MKTTLQMENERKVMYIDQFSNLPVYHYVYLSVLVYISTVLILE